MTDIRFYHLQKTPQAMALPQIAYKAWQAGGKVVVRAGSESERDALNDAMWTFKADVFLPHGTVEDGYAASQPVWVTCSDDNPNGARTLIVSTGCAAPAPDGYELCCVFIDGHDPAQVDGTRAVWKNFKEAGHTLSYWQQGEQGWEKKA